MQLAIALIVAIAVLGFIIAFLQTDKRTRIFSVLIVLLAVISAVREIRDYLASRPRPWIVLDRINSRLDKNPPSAGFFEIKLTNTGEAAATDVIVSVEVSVDGDTLRPGSITKKALIPPGQTVGKTVTLKGDTLGRVWEEELMLTAHVGVTYSGEHGGRYENALEVYFDPARESPVFGAKWRFVGEE